MNGKNFVANAKKASQFVKLHEKYIIEAPSLFVAKNVDGDKEQLLFKSGVEYFN